MADRSARGKRAWAAALLIYGLVAVARPAAAGPPYVTDDPEPTDPGHWEIYNFVSAIGVAGAAAGQAGFDINYGGVRDVQLTATLPLDFDSRAGTGPGDVELAVKYRFLHQAEGSAMPDMAVFPRLFVPSAGPQFGPDRARLFLPVWAQKDFGPWSLFGGGGYEIDPAPGQRDFWQSGAVLSRAMGERLSLGVEVYHQTPNTAAARAFTGLNIGATYKMSEHWSLLGAAGPGLRNAREGGQYDAYVALEATY